MYTVNRRQFALASSLVLVLSLVACKRSEPVTPSPPPNTTSIVSAEGKTAATQITGEYLRDQITRFSADEFEGRGPGTPADEKARAYLVQQLQQIGFEPGGPDQSWQQSFDLVGMTSKLPPQWTFKRGNKTASFKWWDQFIGASGVQQEKVSIKNAEVVFVGYGIQAPEFGWDDFKGEDLKGKILLMLNNDPDWDPALFAGTTRLFYGRWVYKYESAARQGAAGAIIIHTTPSAGYPYQVVQTSWGGEQFELPAANEPRVQIKSWLTAEAAKQLVAMSGNDLDKLIESAKSRDFKPVHLGVTTSLTFSNELHRSTTANVYGVLKGSDPQLASEYVIYTAHHDHLGIGAPDANGDKIYNGARDNASGVATVLAIGKAYKALPTLPKRSIMLLFVAAEEQGLLGSNYYATHPTVESGRIAANINYDSANVWGGTSDVTYIGKGKSTLDATADAVAAAQERIVLPDQLPDHGSFYRSDQFNFAKIGVPALYVSPGMNVIGKPEGWGKTQRDDYEARNYHQPSDEITPQWSFDGMVQDAQFGFWAGVAIANAPSMPMWVPGDEFEAARKSALAAVRPVTP
jgi:Zn-dependent M28 family amino/carboxypeptidase